VQCQESSGSRECPPCVEALSLIRKRFSLPSRGTSLVEAGHRQGPKRVPTVVFDRLSIVSWIFSVRPPPLGLALGYSDIRKCRTHCGYFGSTTEHQVTYTYEARLSVNHHHFCELPTVDA
jgi:hypothetical protein